MTLQKYKREAEATKCEMTTCQNLLAFDRIEINGHVWRFCSECHDRVGTFLGFLNIAVGVEFSFRILGREKE